MTIFKDVFSHGIAFISILAIVFSILAIVFSYFNQITKEY